MAPSHYHNHTQCQIVKQRCSHAPCQSHSNSNSPSYSHRRNGNSVSYTLFLYREELCRHNARHLCLSRTKIKLIDKLITSTVRNIQACNTEDLRALSRKMMFKKQLVQQLHRICKLRWRGIRIPHTATASTEL